MRASIVTGLLMSGALALPFLAQGSSVPDADLDALLTRYSEVEELGFVVLVARGSEVVFQKAYGMADRKRRLPNYVDTAFVIGSIGKTFTAAAIYELVSDGRLNLGDTLGKHFDNVPTDKQGITVDQILNHAAGFLQYHDRKGDFEVMSRELALERIFASELRSPPGETYAYSNAGYTLLAILVEEITGQTFRDYCREQFFEPLGLSHTGYYGDTELWKQDRVATGYGDSRRGKNSPWHWRANDLWALVGNGGVVSTAEDMLRWARVRERYFPAPRPTADLGKKRRFSDGWYLARRDNTGLQVFHGGASDKGFIAMLRSYPEHDTILVLLSNTFVAKKPHIRDHMDEIEDLLFVP